MYANEMAPKTNTVRSLVAYMSTLVTVAPHLSKPSFMFKTVKKAINLSTTVIQAMIADSMGNTKPLKASIATIAGRDSEKCACARMV